MFRFLVSYILVVLSSIFILILYFIYIGVTQSFNGYLFDGFIAHVVFLIPLSLGGCIIGEILF